MALTQAQIEAREGKLTASAVGILMSGNSAKIINLWRELIGDPDYKREDLDGVWPVALGSHTESLQLDWYERKTGHSVIRRGEVVVSAEHKWAAATLDGWDSVDGVPIEAKHVGGFEPIARIIERYNAQCTWQMMVTQTDTCMLSIIVGAKEPTRYKRKWDETYAAELLSRAEDFMDCVRNLRKPE